MYPSCRSRSSAARTGVRLTPSRAATSRSTSRLPGRQPSAHDPLAQLLVHRQRTLAARDRRDVRRRGVRSLHRGGGAASGHDRHLGEVCGNGKSIARSAPLARSRERGTSLPKRHTNFVHESKYQFPRYAGERPCAPPLARSAPGACAPPPPLRSPVSLAYGPRVRAQTGGTLAERIQRVVDRPEFKHATVRHRVLFARLQQADLHAERRQALRAGLHDEAAHRGHGARAPGRRLSVPHARLPHGEHRQERHAQRRSRARRQRRSESLRTRAHRRHARLRE